MYTSENTINAEVLLNHLLTIRRTLEPTGKLDIDTIGRDYERGLRKRLFIEQSPLLSNALPVYLSNHAAELSPRTRSEYSTYLRRILRDYPASRQLHTAELQSAHCAELLRQVFPTPDGRNKARRLLHTFFEYAVHRGWSEHNPIHRVPTESANKQTPSILTPHELQRLFRLAQRPRHRDIFIPLALILWEGLRVSEVARERWETLPTSQLSQPLRLILQHFRHPTKGSVLPPTWRRNWYHLRREAELSDINSDHLRHTGIICRQICERKKTTPLSPQQPTLLTRREAKAILSGTNLLNAEAE